MRFRFVRLRFRFNALERLYFPPGKAGNIVRGAFGHMLKDVACAPECSDARTCEQRATCAYARTFEPVGTDAFPSGFADLPRAFVFRANHLDGRTVHAGSKFSFDVNLFAAEDPPVAEFVLAFARLANEGMGPGRARVVMTAVDQVDAAEEAEAIRRVYDGSRFPAPEPLAPSEISLLADPGLKVRRLQIRFLSPTEIKHGGEVLRRPEFGPLIARIRDRVSTLSALYGDGPLPLDFAAFGERASRVEMTRCEIREVDVERWSSHTGQIHRLGGFVGVAEYEGDLGEFVPFLKAAEFAGVGRQTTWGKGELRSHLL